MTDKRLEILAELYGMPYDLFAKEFTIVPIKKALEMSEMFAEMSFNAGRTPMYFEPDTQYVYENFKDWFKQQTERGE